eukprot:1922783-Rhodomonas_salina.1
MGLIRFDAVAHHTAALHAIFVPERDVNGCNRPAAAQFVPQHTFIAIKFVAGPGGCTLLRGRCPKSEPDSELERST